ncbi:hypothetical protein QBC46DRAFT_427782 [Diplogelasinospora grovesii]|uniref:Mid2 domain-containing protein n=1 Tax=Diplogelasinospora grovesii TaxID=303347 RepID=A0AAN6NBF7_9PEZI|nr:hypothetical protein QBC46DRAFT_427782 [Diplogelasinospora grovesii]
MHFLTLLSLPAALVLLFPAQISATPACYMVDGSVAPPSFVPCDTSAAVSACCASNQTNPDICMSSGLCYSTNGDHAGFIYANGCTDKTGESSICPHICPNQANNWEGGSAARSWNVLQCSPGAFCCRPSTNMTNCCDNSTALITATSVGALLIATATATISSSTGAAAAVMTVTATATAEPITQAVCKDNTAVVGGALGAALGAALLASLGAIAWLCLRRPKPVSPPQTVTGYPEYTQAEAKTFQHPQELEVRKPVYEVQG